jgi:hypothetical protein
VAPELDSFVVSLRKDYVDILETLCGSHVKIRKLIVRKGVGDVELGQIFIDLVDSYPELESLSLTNVDLFPFCVCSVIPRLKKLSELELSCCSVCFVYVKQFETNHVCICEHMLQNTGVNIFYIRGVFRK